MSERSKINKLFSEHFTYLDLLVAEILPDRSWKQRGPIVMAFSELERDLYFVYDVVAITCNAGMGAWIHYHIDDVGWIDDAARAFEAIGHKGVGESLKECRNRYLKVNGLPEEFSDSDLSEPVWDGEDQIQSDLYRHLVEAHFQFQRIQGSKSPN